MTGDSVSIREFLTARLDEDEAAAKDAAERSVQWQLAEQAPTPWGEDDPPEQILAGGKPIMTFAVEYGGPLAVDHVLRHDPARVLREIAAKRRHIAMNEAARAELRRRLDVVNTAAKADLTRANIDYYEALGTHSATEHLLLADASVYADHPDYDPAWRLED